MGDQQPPERSAPTDPQGDRARFVALVEAAQRGNQDAFEELYRERVGPVGRYVAALLSDTSVAEDVVAQTFLLAWRDLPRLRDCARFDAWLFRIARNQAITAARRRRHTAPLDAIPQIESGDSVGLPGAELEREAAREEVRRALHTLPAAQRDVLVLRFMAELSHSEVAARLEKTEEATRALQYRALANLRRALRRFQ